MQHTQPPTKQELLARIEKLYNAVNSRYSDWGAAFIVDKVNQYYFMGTMQDGVFILTSSGDYAYCVRNSHERATIESPLDNVYPMSGYKDAADIVGADVGVALIESEVMPCAMLERLSKYFNISDTAPIDAIVRTVRAVKSAYELAIMEESGRHHQTLMQTVIPRLLREGMSETDLTAELFRETIKMGYHGVSRFSMFQTPCALGQFGFGENSLYPTNFDGAGGMKGMSAAVPLIGDRARTLKKGDLVFVDIAYGINGYHTDCTQMYMFGAEPNEQTLRLHRQCLQIELNMAAKLKPGAIPSVLYNEAMDALDDEFKANFMGFGERRVRYIGHGIGLYIDEYPIITNGFDEPLEENMVVALEPKHGLAGVGLLGVEDTYVVTPQGGRCLTGGERDIVVV
ncbi:MAG: Xaa-Pro peptidase family protein [Oscillospiraceae bacterium]|nr:Xaa-Pro peptidase family protein [Oscillospiraceae bacterium]